MRTLILLAVVTLLDACTVTPTQYRGDTDVFADGIDNAVIAYSEEQNHYLTYLNVLEMRKLMRDRPSLIDGPDYGACGDSIVAWRNEWDAESGIAGPDYDDGLNRLLSACALHRTNGEKVEQLMIRVGDPTPNHTRLARALQRYAAALAELASSADDREAFDSAAGQAQDNILGLVASVRDIGVQLGASDRLNIDDELTVIGSAIIQGIGSKLEADRRAALARIVAATGPSINEASQHLASITRFYHLAALPNLANNYEAATDAIDVNVRSSTTLYGPALDRVMAAHETLMVYARTDPGAVFEQMIDAHQALQVKLEDPDAALQDLAGSLQIFYETSRDVLTAIRAARVKLEGGVVDE